MQQKIDSIVKSYTEILEKSKTLNEIIDIKVKVFGKNGEFTNLMKELKDVSNEERPKLGKALNEAKVLLEEKINVFEKKILDLEKEKKLASEKIDITLPSKARKLGNLHPITLVKNEVINAFVSLGFEVVDGPEIELDFYNFQALNMPLDHPARDMQDTFYINEKIVLRTHTSPMQARTMEERGNTPLRILCPGKTYRADDDATHSPMFNQIEGLVVDKNVTMRDLKGVLDEFAKKLFDKDTKTRLRPSYFPFTEPSVEVDLSCTCKGKGCRICKGTGWIEILGAGIVNRKVLQNCKIDPDKFSAFAFGMGLERIAMIKYGIPDMRMLFENDARFLRQFK